MVTRLKNTGCFGSGHYRTDRHARAKALRQRHHVRQDARPLVGKPLTSAAHTALHFVNHHQPVLFVAKLTNGLHIFNPHRLNAAFTLDGFHKHGDHIGVAYCGFFQRLDVVDGHANKALHHGSKAFFDLVVASGCQGGERAAME